MLIQIDSIYFSWKIVTSKYLYRGLSLVSQLKFLESKRDWLRDQHLLAQTLEDILNIFLLIKLHTSLLSVIIKHQEKVLCSIIFYNVFIASGLIENWKGQFKHWFFRRSGWQTLKGLTFI